MRNLERRVGIVDSIAGGNVRVNTHVNGEPTRSWHSFPISGDAAVSIGDPIEMRFTVTKQPGAGYFQSTLSWARVDLDYIFRR